MEKELSYSFNVVLSPDVSERLRDVQEKITGAIKEQRNYDTSPHLSLVNKFMDRSQTRALADALVQEFKNDPVWELEFADFAPSPTGGYIFLNLSELSQRRLIDMHDRALAVTRGIGNEGQNGAPAKYSYIPHISIIKLLSEEVDKALKLIAHDLSGIRMPVKALEVTRQEDIGNDFSRFPVIATINLK